MRNITTDLTMQTENYGHCRVHEFGDDYHEDVACVDVWIENGEVELEGTADALAIAEEIKLVETIKAKLVAQAVVKNQIRVMNEFNAYFNNAMQRMAYGK